MTTDEDYELISQNELKDLKKQIDEIKNTSGSVPEQEKRSLQTSIDALTISITKLLDVFKDANKHMKDSETDVLDKVNPMILKMDDLLEQNKKIAKGIVAIADMVKDQQEAIGKQQREAANGNSSQFSNQGGFNSKPSFEQNTPNFGGPSSMPSMGAQPGRSSEVFGMPGQNQFGSSGFSMPANKPMPSMGDSPFGAPPSFGQPPQGLPPHGDGIPPPTFMPQEPPKPHDGKKFGFFKK